MKQILVVLSAAAWLSVGVAGAAEAPTLTDAQRWQVTAVMQRIELAQLRAQLAQRDFDQAKAELLGLAKALHVEGFDLDLATMTYRAVPLTGQGDGVSQDKTR